MSTKIPADAFEVYFGLGTERSYRAVAKHYRVSKRAVAARAVAERWQDRIVERERKARERAEEKALETLESMNTRHLKSLKVIQGKALEALRSLPLSTAMEAVRALDLGIRQERLIRGEPSDRTALTVEEVIKGEYARWMTPPGNHETEDQEEEP